MSNTANKPFSEWTLDEKLAEGYKVWCITTQQGSPLAGVHILITRKVGDTTHPYRDSNGSYWHSVRELSPDDLVVPPPRWEDNVSSENPVSCWVSNSHDRPDENARGCVDIIFNYISSTGLYTGWSAWKYAIPVKPGELPILGENNG